MILKLSNKENTYTFTVDDLNNGEKLYYKFQIPASDVVDGKYNMVLMDDDGNIITEEQVCMGYFNAETIQYNRGENVYINSPLNANLEDVRTITIDVPSYTIYPSEGYDAMKEVVVDAQPVYDNGYNEGENIGYNSGYTVGKEEGLDEGYQEGLERGYQNGFDNGVIEQKKLLTNITITENGTYTREDGYNEVVVNVEDTNGSYDEGYQAGIEYASENAEEIAAANAIDLVATEFGTYYTKYSDNIVYPEVTGVFPNGENFYDYSIGKYHYETGLATSENTKIEIWFYNDGVDNFGFYYFRTKNMGLYSFALRIKPYGEGYRASIGGNDIDFTLEVGWHNIAMSFADGLIVDGEKIGDFSGNIFNTQYIEIGENIGLSTPNLTIGMIKIDDNVIIPTADGLLNTTTNQLLEKINNNVTYKYINNDTIILPNLIKTVNVQPKVNVAEIGLKFGNSTFTEVPEIFDFSNVTDYSYMFNNCSSLQTIPQLDTSNVTNMSYMFNNCGALQTIPQLDTSNVTTMEGMFYICSSLQTIPELDTSNVTNMSFMFDGCKSLQTIPAIDTSNVTNMRQMFYESSNFISIPPLNAGKISFDNYSGLFYFTTMNNLTDFGGLIDFKGNANNDYTFVRCPNLTYQSCINILNGLYDFTGNGETPTSSQGQLKVHPNFLTTVGEEISIGIAKGWSISA